jgi:RimJ/RimL family protein N-acetyltransferase
MVQEERSLEGRWVRLEPLAETHWAGLCAVGLDPELWEWMPSRITNKAEMRDFIAAARLPGNRAFATVERASGRVAGTTRFMNVDPANRRVEIGWTWLGRAWQRTAVNTEAKFLMLRHAFEELGCVRVELKTDALNQRSRAAILRIGAKEEGTLRQHMVTWSGRLRDTVYYSILDAEWPAVKAGLEAKLGESSSA